MAISVVVVVEGVADELCKLLSEKASALKIGPGNEAENEMGPLITNDHKNKVIDYIQQGIDSGAKILLDGREHEMTNKPGFFLGPTLFDGVSPEMSIYKEEIFGPVLVYTFGGCKDSIFGSSNIYGMDGIRFFTRTKTVTARWVDDDETINLSMPTVE